MEEEYFKNSSNKCLHIYLRNSKDYARKTEWIRRDNSNLNLYVKLKSSAAKKMKLGVFGYSIAKYYLNANKEKSYSEI